MISLLMRITVVSLIIVRWGVWKLTEKEADTKKKKTKHFKCLTNSPYIAARVILELLVISQLLGIITILPIFLYAMLIQYIGFVICIIAFGILIAARLNLGTNWANCYEYQIKQNQELVTSGIYRFVRHPIYSGLVLLSIGAEMVASSFLFIPAMVLFISAYYQARLEEKLLLKHFNREYDVYMSKTKRFIPFVF